MGSEGGMGAEAERFARAERVFAESLEAPAGEQQAFVDLACGQDTLLRDLVMRLLEADATADVRLDEPMVAPDAILEKVPDEIAGFRVLGVLGEGGMGVVYDAEQESPRRRVALKVVRAGSLSDGAVRRFRFECEVLARLDHPGIATIYGSGTAEIDGRVRPYFAMELVRGEPVTVARGVRAGGGGGRESSIADRLKLIGAVCDAVHHAHTRGVIHRDLKPGNVLVTEDGRVKVLDFGVARAIDPELERSTLMTRQGQVVGTPMYMSPEQISGDTGVIDARSDVYAIGVLAYEVLTGRLPYAGEGGSIYAIAHAIREQTPTSMSVVDRSLRGDIETIIGKALEKDPERRYQSASELASDIRRYLERQPILARRPSTWYQAQRFASRNPGLVGGIGVAFVVLVAALGIVLMALRETELQRAKAERERGVLQDVNAFFLDDLFALADPRKGGDRTITLIDAINRASDSVSDRFTDSPEVESAIRDVMGEMHMTLDDYDRAVPNLERAVGLALRSAEHDPGVVSDRRNNLALVYMDLGEQAKAQEVLGANLKMLETELPGDHERRTDTLLNLAHAVYKERNEDSIGRAVPMLERAVAYGMEHCPEYDGTLNAKSSLALVYQQSGQRDKAVAMYDEIIARTVGLNGPDHPDTLTVRTNRAMLLTDLGRYEEADTELREILSLRIETMGADNVDTNVARSMLARSYNKQERFREASELLEVSVAGFERTLGIEHPYARIARGMIRKAYEGLGRPEDATRYENDARAGRGAGVISTDGTGGVDAGASGGDDDG